MFSKKGFMDKSQTKKMEFWKGMQKEKLGHPVNFPGYPRQCGVFEKIQESREKKSTWTQKKLTANRPVWILP